MRGRGSQLHDDITDVPGIRVGHATDRRAKTGVTVILPEAEKATAGLYRGGNATSTRQMDSLSPFHLVDRIHGICFCGGSAFGLDATGGVLAYLEQKGTGIPVTGKVIPIVPSAAIFDLNFGDWRVRPDRSTGLLACEKASRKPVELGSVGAGTGATVGKLFGIEAAMKGGVGSASAISEDLIVGALVVVNAYGDIHFGEEGPIAGVRKSAVSQELADAVNLLTAGKAVSRPVAPENTTLSVIAVNSKLDKISAAWIAGQATLGLGSVIKPFHTHIDGDLTIVVGVGDKEVDPNRVGLMAAEVLQRSVIKAVMFARGFGILPAWRDLAGGQTSIDGCR